MVQILKDEIHSRIIISATQEFFAHGFKNATMRKIAGNAGIPTGLIYSYFQNKKELFEAVVEPTYRSMNDMFRAETESQSPLFENFFINETEQLLSLLKAQRVQFLILIEKSIGTRYEAILNDIIDATQAHIKTHLQALRKNSTIQLNDDFFYIIAANFINGYIEIARRYQGEEWAKTMVKLLGMEFFYGINSFI
jgi:AcrR family transcriptional regulator